MQDLDQVIVVKHKIKEYLSRLQFDASFRSTIFAEYR